MANRCQYQWSGVEGWRPQVNKFELVSINGHWMSLTVGTRAGAEGPILDIWRGGWAREVPCLMSRVVGPGGLYSEVDYIMDNGHMGIPCGPND